jgi:hypothetical protein
MRRTLTALAVLLVIIAGYTASAPALAQGGGAWHLIGASDGALYVVADNVRHRVIALAPPDDLIETIPLGDAWGYTFGGRVAPDHPARDASERVLLDMVIQSSPAVPTGACMLVEPGTIKVTVQAIGGAPLQPVRFDISPMGAGNPDSGVGALVAPESETYAARVSEGTPGSPRVVCYALTNETPADSPLPHWAQSVAIKLAWSPS